MCARGTFDGRSLKAIPHGRKISLFVTMKSRIVTFVNGRSHVSAKKITFFCHEFVFVEFFTTVHCHTRDNYDDARTSHVFCHDS